MIFKHFSINAWRDFYQVRFERNTFFIAGQKDCFFDTLAELFRQICKKFSFFVQKT